MFQRIRNDQEISHQDQDEKAKEKNCKEGCCQAAASLFFTGIFTAFLLLDLGHKKTFSYIVKENRAAIGFFNHIVRIAWGEKLKTGILTFKKISYFQMIIPFHLPIQQLSSPAWEDYELLDSGNGSKLERFGPHILARPEAEAIWEPAEKERVWQKAEAIFQPSPEENGGHWRFRQQIPEEWLLSYKDLRFNIRLSNSRHVGIFPEQASQWDLIRASVAKRHSPRILNLFGYTGLVTLAAAAGGAQVTHVDASRKAIAWARQNQELSGLQDKPIRWIVDDALKFVQREVRRGSLYDGIILDPPKFGRGPKGEVWEFYTLLPHLLQACRNLLTPKPLFLLITAYAVKASSLTLGTAFAELMAGIAGNTTVGELVIKDKSRGRSLSTAVFALWTEPGLDLSSFLRSSP